MELENPENPKKSKPIQLLHAQNEYNPKVQITNWDILREAFPKDNDPYNPPGGNYFLSTYNRIGNLTNEIPNSTTHDMLEQIWNKAEYGTIYPRKPLLSFLSYPCSENHTSNELIEAGISQYQSDYGITDYCTTNQRDYQPINAIPTKPFEFPQQPRQRNILCLSELKDAASIRRHGINTFMDDGQSDFYKNRCLRWDRYSSYDPINGRYTIEKHPQFH